MTRYHFDRTNGTVDEIDIDEELVREQAREEAAAEEYEAFLEREYARSTDKDGEKARQEEAAYWNEQERRKWELLDKLLAQAYGKD